MLASTRLCDNHIYGVASHRPTRQMPANMRAGKSTKENAAVAADGAGAGAAAIVTISDSSIIWYGQATLGTELLVPVLVTFV